MMTGGKYLVEGMAVCREYTMCAGGLQFAPIHCARMEGRLVLVVDEVKEVPT